MSQMMISIYAFPLLVTVLWMVFRQRKAQSILRQIHIESVDAGLTESASLHPVIESTLCIGCGSCAAACPEHDVLGIIGGKAQLVSPTDCIGHGACQKACPVGAIDLVFGSSQRGVDIPALTPTFETSQTGIYIAGELGGMGLIRNAVEQGRQAMQAIAKSLTKRPDLDVDADVVVVGAGPAGISASLQAKEQGLRCITIDQESLGGTVAHFPKNKLVMTQPAILPIVGKMNFSEIQKEDLLEFWGKVIDEQKIKINFNEKVEAISSKNHKFVIKTPERSYTAHRILLTIGRRGSPRKLDVKGEEQSKVVYRMSDPEQYKESHVLVVGGGDSALEAACSIAELGNPNVTLCYRSGAFSRAKGKNRKRVDALSESGKLRVMLNCTPVSIGQTEVVLKQADESISMDNDNVIICAGGILPFQFLRDIGIDVETKYGSS